MPPGGSPNSAAVPNCSASASRSTCSLWASALLSLGTWLAKCLAQNSASTICSSAPDAAFDRRDRAGRILDGRDGVDVLGRDALGLELLELGLERVHAHAVAVER